MKSLKLSTLAVLALAVGAQTFASESPKNLGSAPSLASELSMYPSIWISDGAAALSNPHGAPIVVEYLLTVEDRWGRVFTLARRAVIFAGGTYFDRPFGTAVLGGEITAWNFA